MGVITESDVDYGRIYGPFPAVGHIPKSHFIGYMTSDERHESASNKIDVNDGYLGTTWLPYVHPARTVDEQNMEAYMKDGHIYYRTLRIIRAGEELLVWYSKDFADILSIPSVTNMRQQGDNDGYRCPDCTEEFMHTYSLMAHRRFRCAKSSSYNNSTESTPSPSQQGHVISGMYSDNQDSMANNGKRKVSVDTGEQRKKLRLDVGIEENNNNNKTDIESSQKSGNVYIDPDIGSAFKKVEKSKQVNPLIQEERRRESAVETLTADKDHLFPNRKQTDLEYFRPVYKSEADINRYKGRAMLMQNWGVFTNGGLPTGDPRRFAPTSTSLSSLSGIPKGMGVLSQDAIRRFPNGEMISKQILMEQLRKSHLPMIPTSNPMVEKILQTASNPVLLKQPMQPLNLAQNWCAKCNATFRMTSDLVYHMRSHHKREFDPIKKKRDDKLQCNVCNETFKERHHLTRHMTSHM